MLDRSRWKSGVLVMAVGVMLLTGGMARGQSDEPAAAASLTSSQADAPAGKVRFIPGEDGLEVAIQLGGDTAENASYFTFARVKGGSREMTSLRTNAQGHVSETVTLRLSASQEDDQQLQARGKVTGPSNSADQKVTFTTGWVDVPLE